MVSSIRRFANHWVAALRTARRDFPAAVRTRIEAEITLSEANHRGEICFAVQSALGFPALWRGDSARIHALGAFANLGVWDTAANNGVLIYVLLGDKAVEFVADRGLSTQIAEAEWTQLCREVETLFHARRFEDGGIYAVRGVAALLARHFPATGNRSNELPNQPVLL
jgi:uncharacterized membrane protein